jgi:uncharacterized protein (DUF1015 family)
MSLVRRFPARVVRQEWARRTVSSLAESVDESGIDLYGVRIDPAAYDESPVALYVYRQSSDPADPRASHVGIVCDVSVQALADGRVRGHEAVHPKRVEALVWHHQQTAHGTPALVSLLHRAGEVYTRTLETIQQTPPVLDFAGPSGFQQTVWRLPEDDDTQALVDELAGADYYIADGHHRVSAALEEWRLAGKPDDAGILCQIHPMDGLQLSSFHRRVSGPLAVEGILGLLSGEFDVREVSRATRPAVGSMGLYVDHRWFVVTYRGARRAGVAGLDVTLLQQLVLDQVATVAVSGRVPAVDAIPATASVDELTRRCDVDGGALFTLAPPTYDALIEVADAGEVMPPKATYFEPKPCTGIFLRP